MWIAPKIYFEIKYRVIYGKKCNLKQPKTFSEKLIWLNTNVYNKSSLIAILGDKAKVKEYLNNLGYGEYVIPNYFVYQSPDEIELSSLPNQFALKLSVGCGTNYVCFDKNNLNYEELLSRVNQWIKVGFFERNARFVGKPHKEVIVCEKVIGKDYIAPVDYKFYCFNGKPMAILCVSERNTDTKHGCFMSLDWNLIEDLGESHPKKYAKLLELPEKPMNLNRMVSISQELSAPFPFMRIDLYDVDGEIRFGEFTMAPGGCIGVSETIVDGKSMGDLLELNLEEFYKAENEAVEWINN